MSLPPRVLFLPGVGGDPAFWRPVGDQLPPDWAKIYLGWSGLGNYHHGPPLRSVDEMVAQVEQQLGAEPVDLVAQSLGGVIAARVALRQPARIRRLVLTATSGGLDVHRLGAADWRDEYRREFPAVADWVFKPWPDLSDKLRHLAQPTLLLWADNDPISPLAVGRKLHATIPGATLAVIAAHDHAFARQRAAEVAPLVARHLG